MPQIGCLLTRPWAWTLSPYARDHIQKDSPGLLSPPSVMPLSASHPGPVRLCSSHQTATQRGAPIN